MSAVAAKRNRPTLTQQVEVLLRQGVVCPGTGEIVHQVEWDHRIPVELHVKDSIDPNRTDNWQALDPDYHRTVKTPADAKVIAKVKRAAGETGQQARRKKRGGSSIKSRGFDKTFKKKLDGTVERRE